MDIFKNIIGHETAKKILKKRVDGTNSGHGFLFYGEEHLGKNTMAERFIMAMNCETRSACGECKNSGQILRNTFPYLIKATSKWSEIKKDLLSERVNFLQLRQPEGIVKFLLIDDAANLNISSSNMLLKTIEEPPENTIIILITSRIDNILPTIKSRCQLIPFNRVSNSELSQLLKDIEEVSIRQDILRTSEGKPGIARLTLDNLDKFTSIRLDGVNFIDIVDMIYDTWIEEPLFHVENSGIDYSGLENLLFSRSLMKAKLVSLFIDIINSGTTWESLSSANYLKSKISLFFDEAEDNLMARIDDESDRLDKKVMDFFKKEGREKIKSFKEGEIRDILHFSIRSLRDDFINYDGEIGKVPVKWLEILSELKQVHLKYNIKSDNVMEYMVVKLRRNRFNET